MKKIYILLVIIFLFSPILFSQNYSFFHGKGLALWQDDKYGGQVVEKYRTEGKLEDGKSYFILSGNVKETMKAMVDYWS